MLSVVDGLSERRSGRRREGEKEETSPSVGNLSTKERIKEETVSLIQCGSVCVRVYVCVCVCVCACVCADAYVALKTAGVACGCKAGRLLVVQRLCCGCCGCVASARLSHPLPDVCMLLLRFAWCFLFRERSCAAMARDFFFQTSQLAC